MKASVQWVDNMRFVGHSETGHSTVFDCDSSGSSSAPSPMETVAMSLGTCASIDVIMILEKSKQDVTDCKVNISGERAESAPRVFTDIHLEFVITGHDLKEKQVSRAVELSAEKYCSVKLMLDKAVNITHSYIIEAA